MNGREWKPGDVAMVDGYVSVRANSDAWYRSAPKDVLLVDSDSPNVRPLVVIDPEDAEQVERLLASLSVRGWEVGEAESHDDMAIALREFANPTPPKPAEPTGLGAVVEAIYDNHFVHIGGGNWQRVSGDEFDQTCPYADIDVVRIVSEGVTL